MSSGQDQDGDEVKRLRSIGMSDGEVLTTLLNRLDTQRGIQATLRELLSEVIAERDALRAELQRSSKDARQVDADEGER